MSTQQTNNQPENHSCSPQPQTDLAVPQDEPGQVDSSLPAPGSPDSLPDDCASDGNEINGNFIRRQKQLTEIVTNLSNPNKSEAFPLIVGVASLDEETVKLIFPAKAPTSVVDSLLGFTAPADWEALVVVAEGLAHSEAEDQKDVTVGYGLTRLGEEISVLRLPDEEVLVSTLPSEGRVLDCCRRAFGLDTPPVQNSTVELIVSAWLARIYSDAKTASQETDMDLPKNLNEADKDAPEVSTSTDLSDWQSLARRHPLVDCEDEELEPVELGEQVRKICEAGNWGKIRQAVAEGEISHVSITPEQAEWMDDAMFSRWCLADFPDSEVLLEKLAEILPSDLYGDLTLCLAEQLGQEG